MVYFKLYFNVKNEGLHVKVVVKVGTSTLAHPTGLLNIRRMEKLCKVLSDIKNAGHQVILVSSGAIGMGVGKLSLPGRPDDTPTKQVAAAVGQCELMYTYDKLFSEHNHIVAQILITSEDVDHPERSQNLHNTLSRCLQLNVLPIINENDTVVTTEIAVGDNDTLAAILARSIQADLMVILSDIEGLYTGDPRKNPDARLIDCVQQITPEIEALGGNAGSLHGTGGMATKIAAAKIVTETGADMVVANGEDPAILYDIMAGGRAGTLFVGRKGQTV